MINKSGESLLGSPVQDRQSLARAAQMETTGSVRCREPKDDRAGRALEGLITAKGHGAILLLC